MLLAVACAGTAIASPNFVAAPGSPYSTDTDPYSVSAGAFNGDSRTDLAVINGTTSTVQLFNQFPGNGGFGLSGAGFSVPAGPNIATVADFDGNGLQDLALGSFNLGQVTVWLHQANNTYTQEGGAYPAGGQVTAIGSANFDGTGGPDLAIALNGGSVQILLRNNANNGFVNGANPGTGGTQPRFVAPGDVDSDGKPDVVVSNSGSNTVAVLRNTGGGTFAAAATTAVGSQPQYVVVANLDGDTKPDIAVTNYGSGTVSVLDQQPGGLFMNAPGSPYTVGTNPVGLAAADFDGSGHLDLVAANNGSASFSVLKNDGTSFAKTQDVPVTAGPVPNGITTGLFNDGDTIADVAVTAYGITPGRLSVFLNKPPPPTASAGDATALTQTTATLNGSVNPQRADTEAHFEYGTTTAYGSRVPGGGEIPVGTDAGDHAISRVIDGLAPNTIYHYRVVATSFGGTTVSDDKSFVTADPVPHDAAPKPPGSVGSGPPQAYLVAPTEIAVGTPTVLSAQGSTPAGDLVSFKLDLDGSGKYATDLGATRSLSTVFTTAGDIKVGLRVEDNQGRVDVVRRTVKVTAPPLYGFSFSPKEPDTGEKVTFRIRELIDDPNSPGAPLTRDLAKDTVTTMTFGDGSKPTGNVEGIRIVGRAASPNGTFTHSYTKSGNYKVHLTVDDGHGYQQGLDAVLPVSHTSNYQPAISTPTTTVDQGSCVAFTNATGYQLGIHEVGTPRNVDANPKNLIPVVMPDLGQLRMGGVPKFDLTVKPTINSIKSSVFTAGNPIGQLTFNNNDLQLQFHRRSASHQAEPTVTYAADDVCRLWDQINRIAIDTPPPPTANKEPKWQSLPNCTGGLKLQTFDGENHLLDDLVTKQITDYRHTWFAINQWDFGDGTKSASYERYPQLTVNHPYNKAGTFTVKLTTTLPRDLDKQADTWRDDCAKNPLNAAKPDNRFVTRTTEIKLRVRAHYARIKSRGLSMTSDQDYFEETDFPGVYQTTGSIYLNTRRSTGKIVDAKGNIHPDDYVGNANGVIIVTPREGLLRINPDAGEITGAADLYWMSNGQQVALGPMPLNIRGTPGLVIPPDSGGGAHDFGVFNTPPATLGAGKAFVINWVRPVLLEKGGGTLDINVHLPPPLGPDGQGSDETVSRTVKGNGRAVKVRGLLDDFDIDIPKIVLVPDAVEFEGGKLSHHKDAKFPAAPWTVQGSLKVFKFKVDASPSASEPGCNTQGGLGFYDDGGLAYAGAAVKGLKIPIPNPPAPNPISMLTDPAFTIVPGTSTHPMSLYGCITYTDYPESKAFAIVGCAGLLLAGKGVNVPVGEKIPYCPNEKGEGFFEVNDHNAGPVIGGRRLMKGAVVRISGDVGLGPGPDRYHVLQAFLEFRTDPADIAFKAHYGQDFDLGVGTVSIAADINGNFQDAEHWYIAGEGHIKQTVVCVPKVLTDLVGADRVCAEETIALLGSSNGIGGCVTMNMFSFGGVVQFKGPKIIGELPCGMSDLERDLGVTLQRGLPTAEDMIRRPGDPTAVTSSVQEAAAKLAGKTPYTMLVVNGDGASPRVEVRDPDGKLVIDDNGQPVQGVEGGTPENPKQGLFHSAGQAHNAEVDMRNATVVFIKNPKQGKYDIRAKEGSARITAITHADALQQEHASAGVQRAAAEQQQKLDKKRALQLSIKAQLNKRSTMQVIEQGQQLSHVIAELKARAPGHRAAVAQVSRHIRFTPALGPAEKRKLIGVISRDGVPVKQINLGSYRSPAPPKAGAVRKLRVKRKGTRLTLTWKAAKNARTYEVHLIMKRGLTLDRSVGAKQHKLVISNALAARYGAKITVTPVGPLLVEGKAAKARLKAAKVKRLKRFTFS